MGKPRNSGKNLSSLLYVKELAGNVKYTEFQVIIVCFRKVFFEYLSNVVTL